MMKITFRAVPQMGWLALGVSISAILVSCGLMVDDSRVVENRVKRLEKHLSAQNWKGAATLYDRSFQWKQKGRKRKHTSAKAFHQSLEAIPNFQDAEILVRATKKLPSGKIYVTGSMLIHNNSGGAVRSVQWDLALTWVKRADGWKLLEIAETSPRKKDSD